MLTSVLRILVPGRRLFAALKKVSGAHIKLGLIAAILFALAYAVETKAILALEGIANAMGGHRRSRSKYVPVRRTVANSACYVDIS